MSVFDVGGGWFRTFCIFSTTDAIARGSFFCCLQLFYILECLRFVKITCLGFFELKKKKRVSLFLLEEESVVRSFFPFPFFFFLFGFERELLFVFFLLLIFLLLCVYRSRCSAVYRTALKTVIVCLGSIRWQYSCRTKMTFDVGYFSIYSPLRGKDTVVDVAAQKSRSQSQQKQRGSAMSVKIIEVPVFFDIIIRVHETGWERAVAYTWTKCSYRRHMNSQ